MDAHPRFGWSGLDRNNVVSPGRLVHRFAESSSRSSEVPRGSLLNINRCFLDHPCISTRRRDDLPAKLGGAHRRIPLYVAVPVLKSGSCRVKFSDRAPSNDWAALRHKGATIAEVWFKPQGEPFSLVFRVPQDLETSDIRGPIPLRSYPPTGLDGVPIVFSMLLGEPSAKQSPHALSVLVTGRVR